MESKQHLLLPVELFGDTIIHQVTTMNHEVNILMLIDTLHLIPQFVQPTLCVAYNCEPYLASSLRSGFYPLDINLVEILLPFNLSIIAMDIKSLAGSQKQANKYKYI